MPFFTSGAAGLFSPFLNLIYSRKNDIVKLLYKIRSFISGGAGTRPVRESGLPKNGSSLQIHGTGCLMKKYTFLLFFVLSACIPPLFSVQPNAQQLVPAGHWVYDAIQMLSYETWQTSFADAAPLSVGELRRYLDDIPYEQLSSEGRAQYRRILDYFDETYLSFSSGMLSLGIAPSVNPEAFVKTNATLPWIYDYYKREPFLSVPLFVSAANVVTISSDLYFGQNWWTAARNANYTNIPLDSHAFDAGFPKTAYISAGNGGENSAFFNFQLGMGKLDIGATQTGGLILSDYMVGPSYAQVSLFSPRIRYTVNTTELNVNKYLYLHRLEARPFKWLSVGLIEGVLINAPFELRYLNPAAIFHSIAAWRDYDNYNTGQANGGHYESGDSRAGSYFGVTFSVSPYKYIRLYGQFAMNQYQSSFENNNYGETAAKNPKSIARQAGVESWKPLRGGYIYAGGEAVYTSPYMYILTDPGWSFYREWKELVAPDGKTSTAIRNWTGTPFGPDSYGAQVRIGYDALGKWSVYGTWRLWVKGEINADVFDRESNGKPSYYPTTSAQASVKTPTGIPFFQNLFYVYGDYSPLPWLTVGGLFGFDVTFNSEHRKGNTEFSTEFALYAKIKLYQW